jgi:DNA-binding response OmpR family regulator
MIRLVVFPGDSVLKVLIAEDDLMIADMIEASLVENGYEVSGIARTVAEAVKLGRETRPELAILDMRLADDGLGTEIAEQLHDGRRIGFLFASGNISHVLRLADGDACIAKPYHIHDLLRALRIVEEIVGNGVVSPPFPRGFHLLGGKKSILEESHA